MTIPVKTIRSLRNARRLLRDAAAAEFGVASSTASKAATAAHNADTQVERTLDAATVALAKIKGVADFDRIADNLTSDRHAAAAAAVTAQTAAEKAAEASQALFARERQLRSIDRLIEVRTEEREKSEASAEQRTSDDLTNARSKS